VIGVHHHVVLDQNDQFASPNDRSAEGSITVRRTVGISALQPMVVASERGQPDRRASASAAAAADHIFSTINAIVETNGTAR
jgi:hypothetical protein